MKLERYGIEWMGPKSLIAVTKPDGYWTPWHLAVAEIDRVRGSLDAMGWQPISTAPKDGNHVQLWREDIQFVGYYGGVDSGWRINAPGLPAMWPLPTHWAPLRRKP